ASGRERPVRAPRGRCPPRRPGRLPHLCRRGRETARRSAGEGSRGQAMSWLVSLPCTRDEAEALSGEVPALDALPDAPVVVTREIDEAAARWQLDAYVEAPPSAA